MSDDAARSAGQASGQAAGLAAGRLAGPLHGDLQLDAANLTAYATTVHEHTGVTVTTTHLVGRAVAHGLAAVATSTDVHFVVGDGPDRTAGTTLEGVDARSVAEVARELAVSRAVAEGRRPPEPGAVVASVGMWGMTTAYAPRADDDAVPVRVLVGAVAQRPVAIEGRVVIRPVLTLTLTFDHRHVDGGWAVRFSHAVQEYCAHPDQFEELPARVAGQPAEGGRSDVRVGG